MRRLKASMGLVVAILMASGVAYAQTTTGTITGHVVDQQGFAMPGVTITVEGPNLQGKMSVVSSANGDYIVPLLPPGTYTITFELRGFDRHQETLSIAATQTRPVNATLSTAKVSENVVVVGSSADVLTQTAEVATNFKQDMIRTLPTNGDINATLLMAPAVHPSGPSGNYSIAGAMSFESLFLVNGVTANENLRGQAFNLYIEDAIQETVVATDGVSAEYGRFSGGVVNIITKSGTNQFHGSFRDSLSDDNWRSYVKGNSNFGTPTGALVAATNIPNVPCATVTGRAGTQIPDPHCFANDTKIKNVDLNQATHWVVPTYEYVLGGPIVKNHLTFFTAGRFQNQQTARNTVLPVNFPYISDDQRKRFEVKVSGSVNSNHRIEGSYQKEALTQVNNTFSTATSMDSASLYTRQTPLDSYQFNYNGILSNQFFVEGRFSLRHFSFIGSGAPSTDLIAGTLLLDRARGSLRYFAPTFCGVCDPEKRDNDNESVKVTYFKSTKRGGSHSLVFGFDTFNDKRFANNHQSGSDYRILGTTTIVRDDPSAPDGSGKVIYPQFLSGAAAGAFPTILQYNPIATGSLGTKFRTNGFFINDNLHWNNHLTLNLGLRWDKNHGVDSAGALVAHDSKLAPRLGLVWDPKGDGVTALSASYAVYTAAISNSIADSSSAAGNSAAIQWAYAGPAINPDPNAASLTTSAQAIAQVFGWCNRDSRGFCQGPPITASQVPGVSVKIPNSLDSPNVRALAFGVSRQVGSRAVVRADYSFRDYRDFYSQRVDRSTGTVTDQFGNVSDLAIIENTNNLKRRYSGMTLSATYRVNARTNVGGNYTLSRLWGNWDGENVGSGPLTTDIFQYPEYRNISWYAPIGDLSADQRHRATMWIIYGVPRITGLSVSLLQNLASGTPYGAVGNVDARSFVTNPGYATPQGATTETYYYTNRDAFHTEASRRSDLSANYDFKVGMAPRNVELFLQAQVLNLFNTQDLCACGATVFANGGNVQGNTIGMSVNRIGNFNPLTTTPVQGTNWNYANNFGTPLNRFAFESPRTFRMTFGVKF